LAQRRIVSRRVVCRVHFGLNSPVNGRKVRFDRFGASAPFVGSFGMAIPCAARRPDGQVQSSRFKVQSMSRNLSGSQEPKNLIALSGLFANDSDIELSWFSGN